MAAHALLLAQLPGPATGDGPARPAGLVVQVRQLPLLRPAPAPQPTADAGLGARPPSASVAEPAPPVPVRRAPRAPAPVGTGAMGQALKGDVLDGDVLKGDVLKGDVLKREEPQREGPKSEALHDGAESTPMREAPPDAPVGASTRAAPSASATAWAEPSPPAGAASAADRRRASDVAVTAGTADGAAPARVEPVALRVAPAAVLHYDLRRGSLSGSGELRWAHDGASYQARIVGSAFGLTVLEWNSRGGFDAQGLAPLRFTDKRRGKAERAANFQRERALLSWSDSTAEQPLVAGTQDRLSWMLQLAALVAAAPDRSGAGARVPIPVAGARGDFDTWVFVSAGPARVALADGREIDALLWQRAPRKPYDTRVDVWLDCARACLPARLRLGAGEGEGADAVEFIRRD